MQIKKIISSKADKKSKKQVHKENDQNIDEKLAKEVAKEEITSLKQAEKNLHIDGSKFDSEKLT